MIAKLKRVRVEVGNGKPGYDWVERYNVITPDNSEVFLAGSMREARRYCQENNWKIDTDISVRT